MFIKLNGLNIKSILSVVPKNKFNISRNKKENNSYINCLAKLHGINSCYKSREKSTVDLFIFAAKKILNKNNIEKSSIDILICVTQTPDYLMPSCSNIVHQKLKFKLDCLAFDINLGCSGFVYGLWNIMSAMKSSQMQRGLLLVGDTISKIISKNDLANQLLFGDAVTATLIEKKKNINNFFLLGSALTGYDKLMIKNSGFKDSKLSKKKFIMDGKEVFSFVLRSIPNLVLKLIKESKFNIKNISYFIFHQANKMMLDKVFDLLNVRNKKRLYSIKNFGNTSSASIPLTASFKLSEKKVKNVLLSGFGAGFSFALLITTFKYTKIFKVFRY